MYIRVVLELGRKFKNSHRCTAGGSSVTSALGSGDKGKTCELRPASNKVACAGNVVVLISGRVLKSAPSSALDVLINFQPVDILALLRVARSALRLREA